MATLDLGNKRSKHHALNIFLVALLTLFAVTGTAAAGALIRPTSAAGNDFIPSYLRCEYLVNPIGIDVTHPRFTWEITAIQEAANEENFQQVSYQIYISSSKSALYNIGNTDSNQAKVNHNLLWQSGWINSSENQGMYGGDNCNPAPALKAHTGYYWTVALKDQQGKIYKASAPAYFETAMMQPSDWEAGWITDSHNKDYHAAPMFRKTFNNNKEVKSARLYISAAAYYKAWINGKQVGKNELDPGYTDYSKTHLYVTHDITELLQNSQNAIAVVLGNGFYNEIDSVATWDFDKAHWRERAKFIAEIIITYKDGSISVIGTDSSWKTTTGLYVQNNIYSGDTYDGRKELPGWTKANYRDKDWQQAVLAPVGSAKLTAQMTPAIQIDSILRPVHMQNFGDSVYVFDFGMNMTGVCQLDLSQCGPKGTVVSIQHGELLKQNGRLEMGNLDIYYKSQPGLAFQSDVYILGDKGTFYPAPGFTYHGFRYVEVKSTAPIRLSTASIQAHYFHTNLNPVGHFACSNPILNQIWEATNRTYLNNLHSIPTDCPTREKNGWTADAHIAIDLGLLNFDGITFYEKWLVDLIDNQQPSGQISGIVPSAGWGYDDWIGPVWDAALFIVPDALYHYYNDQRAIARIYPTLVKYLNYLKNREDRTGLVTYGIGDWLPYKTKTPTTFTTSCYYYLDYSLMASFAQLLGKDATAYIQKAKRIKATINQLYFDSTKMSYANGSQTALALPLYLGIVEPAYQQGVANSLQKTVAANDYFLDFGVLGSKTVLRMLTKYGYGEAAYKMASKTTGPSWGNWIREGNTTLTETWIMSEKFHDASLDHVFMGDISAWMYNCLAGINYDGNSSDQESGFKKVLLRPHFVPGLNWAEASYHSKWGTISAKWERIESGKSENGPPKHSPNKSIRYTVCLPVGITGEIHYQDSIIYIKAGTHSFQF